MKNLNIDSYVSFSIEDYDYSGKITDVFEMGYEGNEYNVYEVTTEFGVFYINNDGMAIV